MLNAGVEGLGRRVLREAEDIAAPDTSQPPGSGDQQEAQGPHAAQDIAVRALAGAAAGSGDGVELEAPRDVVGEGAEVLPGAVGAVGAGGGRGWRGGPPPDVGRGCPRAVPAARG